mmetsp:Transcript_15740/g.28671  ORF Transcript_15740/g.28671 Transcript_15740/m.28671 type:complete len:323 (-) Transcript_15740:84-1052(-)
MGQKNSAYHAKFKAKEWQWQLKSEAKQLDKEIVKIKKQEEKLRREIQAQAEKGNVDTVQQLAKSIVRSERAVKRLEGTKANMIAVDLQLTTSIATMTTTSSLKVSADIMTRMNQICGVSEVGATMEAMRAEMSRVADAEDAVEDALQNEDEDYQVAEEVQKVLEGMALEKMGPLHRSTAPKEVFQPPAREATPPAAVAPQRVPVAAGMEYAEKPAAPRPPAQQQPPPQQPQQPAASSGAPAADPPATMPASQAPDPASAPPAAMPPVQPASAPPAAMPPVQPASAPPPPAGGPVESSAPVISDTPQGGADDDLWARLNALKK